MRGDGRTAVAPADFVDVEPWYLGEAAPERVACHDEVEVERDEQAHEFGDGPVVDLGERVVQEDEAQGSAVVAEAGEVAVGGGEQGDVGDEAGFTLGELGAAGEAPLLAVVGAEDGDGDLMPLPVVEGSSEVGRVAAARVRQERWPTSVLWPGARSLPG